MSSSSISRSAAAAVVEPPVGDSASELTERALKQRIRQQEILAELAVLSLRGIPFDELLGRTVALVAEGLEAEFSKIMEYLPTKNLFLVRAGIGWGPDVVGKATIGADLLSPGGFALRTGKPVISNHLEHEQRFRTPHLLVKYGIRRAMNVILKGSGDPFGILEVDSRSSGEFTAHDLTFLQGAGNIVGTAIERQRIESDLRAALDAHKVLLAEINHRVKNSLQLVANMLQLQAKAKAGSESERDLKEAATRVFAIAHVHENLYSGGGTLQAIDLGRYLSDVCKDLDRSIGHCHVEIAAPDGVLVPADRAVPIALVVNELVTNAMKYAYPNVADGRLSVRLDRDGDNLAISVRDHGVGLPKDFDAARGKGLGMRIIRALETQLAATLEVRRLDPGVEFVFHVPIEAPA
ncbi:MAG TPA: histidine kinase dimerization/phosphoacceptor domain -containing protein [Alphaproteobacteria bacterium]